MWSAHRHLPTTQHLIKTDKVKNTTWLGFAILKNRKMFSKNILAIKYDKVSSVSDRLNSFFGGRIILYLPDHFDTSNTERLR